nr:coiled-coil domain-containing protein 148 isoform X1 [Pelodiscus sinensis]|eukprot:XP_006126902.1 coiled-coil domain-containing protein 148 isoform X1 [Pelodiscus sinensis]
MPWGLVSRSTCSCEDLHGSQQAAALPKAGDCQARLPRWKDVRNMSARDLRQFVTTHNASEIDKLVVRMKNGLFSQKYKPVDYKQLYSLTEEKKKTSVNIQLKVKKVEQASKTNKEQMLLKQHHQIWWQEHKQLSENRHKVEAEIQTFLDEVSLEREFLLDMWDLAYKLSKERDTYQTNTVEPIWQLRKDLKYRLSEMQYYPSTNSCMESKFTPVKVLQQVNFVKEQQKTNLELLNQEKLALEQELEDCKAKLLTYSFEEKTGLFHEVPTQLLALECPYPDLKSSVLSEFHKFADEYWTKLQEIDHQLKLITRNFGWSEEDQWVYQTVVNQYPSDLQSRRALYLDMLQRHLPHKSRHELVAHEKAWDQYHFARSQRRALILNWAQARKAFLLKAVMTIAEACAVHETEVMLANNRKKQQDICADLKGKVLQWRAHQQETARLEAAIAARRKEKEDEKEKIQKEKEMIQRAEDKEKVRKYWAEKQRKWQDMEEKDLQRLAELKKLMIEQATKDKERVKFRQELLEKRLMERKELALQEAHEEEERERRLEALRQQVAIVAEIDPARMMADTVASKAKVGIGSEEEFVLHRPLFTLNTYSEQQIISDPRVRVELALREVGLHKTLYAREILPKIPPLKLPRRDMESTIFKM